MKKIIKCMIFVGIGFFLGKIIFTRFDLPSLKKEKEKYYFLQEGVYYQKPEQANLKQKVMEYKNKRIYVYAAITKDLQVAERIMNIYEKRSIKLSIKEKYIKNEEFKNNIEQFDLLINAAKEEEEILKIQEVVLANYEEIIKNREGT